LGANEGSVLRQVENCRSDLSNRVEHQIQKQNQPARVQPGFSQNQPLIMSKENMLLVFLLFLVLLTAYV